MHAVAQQRGKHAGGNGTDDQRPIVSKPKGQRDGDCETEEFLGHLEIEFLAKIQFLAKRDDPNVLQTIDQWRERKNIDDLGDRRLTVKNPQRKVRR